MAECKDVGLYDQTMITVSEMSTYKSKIEVLLLGLIIPDNYVDREEHEICILNSYKECVAECKGIPNYDDIAQDIINYNWEIFSEIAELDFYENYYPGNEEGHDEQEIIDAIAQLTDDWWEEHYYSLMSNVPEYIEDILDANDCCYEFSDSSEMITDYNIYHGGDVKIYKNDAQNIMFPEVHLEQMYFAKSDYLDEDILQVSVVNN